MNPIKAALAVAAFVALAGCSDDSGTLGSVPSRGTTTEPTAVVTASPTEDMVRYEAWFVRDGLLHEAQREGATHERRVAARALRSLVSGPAPEETEAGVSTRLTARDGLRVSSIAGGVATVRADSSFFRRDPRNRLLREAQVVFTLTQYPTIRRVEFTSRPGLARGQTFTRRGLDRLLPSIIVDEPRDGQTTHSPLTISGTANVFEAVVSIRILDAAGKTIARTFTTATCGTGCRGDFSASVRYSVDTAQTGTVEVFEVSMKDGSGVGLVSVPVRLSPSDRAPAG